MTSPFDLSGRTVVIATTHGKERAIGPALAGRGAKCIVPHGIDTDRFGTFTREIARAGSQREGLLAKAREGLRLVSEADFAIASEGAFEPHPLIPFVAGGLELVGIVARDCEEPVIGSDLTAGTNFAHRVVKSWQEAEGFARDVTFPSHGLVMMALPKGAVIAKGIDRIDKLESHVRSALADYPSVHLETDMRAHYNPTRMAAIARASADLAVRLGSRCQRCDFPNWVPHVVAGRPCEWCGGLRANRGSRNRNADAVA